MRWTNSFIAAHPLGFRKLENHHEVVECGCGEWCWPHLIEPGMSLVRGRRKRSRSDPGVSKEAKQEFQGFWKEIFVAWDDHMTSRPEEERRRIAEGGEPNFD